MLLKAIAKTTESLNGKKLTAELREKRNWRIWENGLIDGTIQKTMMMLTKKH